MQTQSAIFQNEQYPTDPEKALQTLPFWTNSNAALLSLKKPHHTVAATINNYCILLSELCFL
jgi:hypothetical protein